MEEPPAPPDQVYCLLHRHGFPDRYPVQVRPDMPVVRARVVAERAGARLLCDRAHDGEHEWPDGEPATPVPEGDTRTVPQRTASA